MSLPEPLDKLPSSVGELGELLQETLLAPKDLARWAFWVPLRNWLDPSHPERLRALFPLWRAALGAGGAQRARMRDEYLRIFGGTFSTESIEEILSDAYRVAFRAHLEELLLGRLDPESVGRFLDLRGREHLDRALQAGRGAIILSAHAGSFMLPIAALSLAGYPYTQYAARGMPPQELAREHPQALPTNRWAQAARRVREENEDHLPARFITLKTPARELYRALGRNELVAMAFDGRIGHRWLRMRYLGRDALLNTGPYRLSEATGAAIIPTLCRTPREGRSICQLGPALLPGDRRWPSLMRDFVEQHAEPWIRRFPSEYGVWLAHCRLRNDIDDHPLFTDHAIDERWKRHPSIQDVEAGRSD